MARFYGLSVSMAALCVNVGSAAEFEFREPGLAAYQFVAAGAKQGAGPKWLAAHAQGDPDAKVSFGDRVVVRLKAEADPSAVLGAEAVKDARSVAPNTFVLQANDAVAAARWAAELSRNPDVLVACPVRRKSVGMDSTYARKPNDRYYPFQASLEFRGFAGERLGAGLNVRAAWPIASGEGVTVGISDIGVEIDHPDLRTRGADGLHYNFATDTSDGNPLLIPSSSYAHGTGVAGLILAERDNLEGIVGVAPDSKFASWVTFVDSGGTLVSDEILMEIYQRSADVVGVQNYSWGHMTKGQEGLTMLEDMGIENAHRLGRGGLGVVIVRSCGNGRQQGANVNDDGYPSDPRVIAVAGTDGAGRVSESSEPGASLLVAAPANDPIGRGVFTTDLTGVNGADQITRIAPDEGREDYFHFSGTSGAAAQISGVAALILSANPALHVRDVQQILIHSARHFDQADPDLEANGAGFLFSHNVGFGMPDAGHAARLARLWPRSPTQQVVTVASANLLSIPDNGLRLQVSGVGAPAELRSIPGLPSTGVHADRPTALVGLMDVGEGLQSSLPDLTGKAALIRRNLSDNWNTPIQNAAAAGAEFAIIYNNATGSLLCPGGEALCIMLDTDFTPIPAMFISQSKGEALVALAQTNSVAKAYLSLNSVRQNLDVDAALICEHVSLRVQSDHPVRGDLRITLTSPSGVTSVLQRLNDDLTPGPVDWTYHSAKHFYESSRGTWSVAIGDEFSGNSGSIQNLELRIRGVRITDADADGLDDGWESAQLGGLTHGPTGDPDQDGYSNAREQILGFDPMAADIEFQSDLSIWNQDLVRISWPGTAERQYEVLSGAVVTGVTEKIADVAGVFPETEFYISRLDLAHKFFRVREKASQ
jgi:subtilisin-like proprotein convertase family protein/subtilisin family serine protease